MKKLIFSCLITTCLLLVACSNNNNDNDSNNSNNQQLFIESLSKNGNKVSVKAMPTKSK